MLTLIRVGDRFSTALFTTLLLDAFTGVKNVRRGFIETNPRRQSRGGETRTRGLLLPKQAR